MIILRLKAQDFFKYGILFLIFISNGCKVLKPIKEKSIISCDLKVNNIYENRNFVFYNKNFDYEYYNDFLKNVTDGVFITFFYEQNPYHEYIIFKDFNFQEKSMLIERNKKQLPKLISSAIVNTFSLVNGEKEYLYNCLNGSTNQVLFLFEMKKKGKKYVRLTSIDNLNFEFNNHNLSKDKMELKNIFFLIQECMKIYRKIE